MVKLEAYNHTLSTGKEIKINPLSWVQRAEIKDSALAGYINKIPVSLVTCGLAAKYALKISDSAIEDFTDSEIYEIGAKVFDDIDISETDKKKSKSEPGA